MAAKEAMMMITEALKVAEDTIQRLHVAKNTLKDALEARHLELEPEKQGPTFMSLPLEIRNMIYRYALVEPHKGYLKCYYEDGPKHYFSLPNYVRNCDISCYVELQLFRVCKQVNIESSTLFYGENTFAIADRPRHNRLNHAQRCSSMSKMDVSRFKKLHLTNRDCKWRYSPRRTSPGVFRDTAKTHISRLGEILKAKPHQLRYLLIDCLSGFGASARMVMNILQPLYGVTKIKQVHIVSTDKDHFPCLRYLEKRLMSQEEGFSGGYMQPSLVTWEYEMDVKDETEQAKLGNEIARLLKIKPCYSASESPGGR